MDPSFNHYLAIVFGGGPLALALIVMIGYRGNPGSPMFFLAGLMCITLGAGAQYIFEGLAFTYQTLNEAEKIDDKTLATLLIDAKFWGQVVGTIVIGLGISILVSYFTSQNNRVCNQCNN